MRYSCTEIAASEISLLICFLDHLRVKAKPDMNLYFQQFLIILFLFRPLRVVSLVSYILSDVLGKQKPASQIVTLERELIITSHMGYTTRGKQVLSAFSLF